MSAHHKSVPKGGGLLPKEVRASIDKVAMGTAAVGVVLCIIAALVDPERLAFSYLTGFLFVATLGLGGLFFVILQHLVRAGWSVAPRRLMEWLSLTLIAVVILFVPIVPFAPTLFKWMKPEAASDHLLVEKAAYLNPSFFYIRAFLFLVLWAGLAVWFYRNSRQQDVTGKLDLSRKMEAFSAPAMFLFALSLTFAAFDWIMSLDPHWYSTIFGVYIFAGAVTSSLAALALVTIKIQQTTVLGDLCTVEHQHDVGKLLFGFVIFWAYIAFSQFMLIWYANIPEETLFYLHRWEGSWKAVSLALVFGNFVVPFWMLLSRHGKRSPTVLGTACVLLLVLHYVDLYWLVMPTLDHHGAHPSWIDLAGLLAPVGIAMVVVSRRALGDPAYPLKDPFIHEALKAENL